MGVFVVREHEFHPAFELSLVPLVLKKLEDSLQKLWCFPKALSVLRCP